MTTIPTYEAIHHRLRRHFGSASGRICAYCGSQAAEWALIGEPKWLDPRPYTDDLDAYTPLCDQCHRRLDLNLPPCPHGPERDRKTDGHCRACVNARVAATRKALYESDPELWERVKAEARERGRKLYASDPLRREVKLARQRERWATDPAYREADRDRKRARRKSVRDQREPS